MPEEILGTFFRKNTVIFLLELIDHIIPNIPIKN